MTDPAGDDNGPAQLLDLYVHDPAAASGSTSTAATYPSCTDTIAPADAVVLHGVSVP